MQTDDPPLLIDHNEPYPVAQELRKGITIIWGDLTTGDYVWVAQGRRWAVERKAGPDLLNSLRSGRLADQVRRLLEFADVPVLLVEGYVEAWYDRKVAVQYGATRWDWDAVDNTLLELQLCGLNVVREPQGKTARRIRSLYQWSLKEEHTALRKRPQVLSYDYESNRALDILTCLPGVGEKTARALLARFGSVYGVVTASEKELMEVDGVGKKTAASIQETVTASGVGAGFR